MKEKHIYVLLAITLVIILGIVINRNTSSFGADVFQSSVIVAPTVNAPVTVTSSTRILATTTASTRAWAKICNDSSNKVYINMDKDKAASLSVGFPLAANTCFDLNSENVYNGSITASSTNESSSSISVTSFEL